MEAWNSFVGLMTLLSSKCVVHALCLATYLLTHNNGYPNGAHLSMHSQEALSAPLKATRYSIAVVCSTSTAFVDR